MKHYGMDFGSCWKKWVLRIRSLAAPSSYLFVHCYEYMCWINILVCRTLIWICRAVILKVEHGKLFWAKFWIHLLTWRCLSRHKDCAFCCFLLLAQLCCFKGFSRVFSLSCRLLLIAERRFLWRIPDSLPGSKPRAGWCPAKRWPTSLVTRLVRECWITEEKTHTCASTNAHTHMPCIQRPFCVD